MQRPETNVSHHGSFPPLSIPTKWQNTVSWRFFVFTVYESIESSPLNFGIWSLGRPIFRLIFNGGRFHTSQFFFGTFFYVTFFLLPVGEVTSFSMSHFSGDDFFSHVMCFPSERVFSSNIFCWTKTLRKTPPSNVFSDFLSRKNHQKTTILRTKRWFFKNTQQILGTKENGTGWKIFSVIGG